MICLNSIMELVGRIRMMLRTLGRLARAGRGRPCGRTLLRDRRRGPCREIEAGALERQIPAACIARVEFQGAVVADDASLIRPTRPCPRGAMMCRGAIGAMLVVGSSTWEERIRLVSALVAIRSRKLSVNLASAYPDRLSPDSQKFFGSFFQKRTALFTACLTAR